MHPAGDRVGHSVPANSGHYRAPYPTGPAPCSMRPALFLLTLLNILTVAPALQSSRMQAMQDPELSSQHSEAFHFLKQHMPAADRHKVSDEFLHEHVRLALRARAANAWAAAVPWHIFLNEVLPYRNLDEPIDQWRPDFVERFSPMVTSATDTLGAAAILNQQIWKIWGIYFKADQAPEILSPSQVIAAGYGSCSALSIFYVDACRAVGIPARVAGTPSWVEDRRTTAERFNNHNWVEVWQDDIWSFIGPLEWTDAGYNHTWFFPEPAKRQIPGDRMHAIYAASYKPTGKYFPLAWSPDEKGVPGVDVTQTYLDTPSTAAAAAPGAVALPADVSAGQKPAEGDQVVA